MEKKAGNVAEFELLRFMAQNPNVVFSKDRLLEAVWGIRLRLGRGDCVSPCEQDPGEDRGRCEKSEDPRDGLGAGYRLNS